MEQEFQYPDEEFQYTPSYKEAILTVSQYLGCPSPSCPVPPLKLRDFINAVFDVNEEILEWPDRDSKFSLTISVYEAQICRTLRLRQGDDIFFKIGNTVEDKQTSTYVKSTYRPKWTDRFATCYKDIIIEFFVKGARKAVESIGRAVIPINSFPASGESIWWYMDCVSNRNLHECGLVKVQCLYKSLNREKRSDLYRKYMLLCQKCLDFRLTCYGGKLHDLCPLPDTEIYLPFRAMKQVFGDEIVTFLHQYCLQNGMTSWENIICSFIVANKFFLTLNKVSVSLIHVLMQDIITMGSWPQRPLDSTLMVTLVQELIPTVNKCSEWLCHIPRELRKNASERSHLKTITEFLFLLDKFFDDKILMKATKKMKERSTFDCRGILETLHNQGDQPENYNRTSNLQAFLDILIQADSIFKDSWGQTYVSIVYERIDNELATVVEELLDKINKENQELRDKLIYYVQKILKRIKESVYVPEGMLKLEKLVIVREKFKELTLDDTFVNEIV